MVNQIAFGAEIPRKTAKCHCCLLGLIEVFHEPFLVSLGLAWCFCFTTQKLTFQQLITVFPTIDHCLSMKRLSLSWNLKLADILYCSFVYFMGTTQTILTSLLCTKSIFFITWLLKLFFASFHGERRYSTENMLMENEVYRGEETQTHTPWGILQEHIKI